MSFEDLFAHYGAGDVDIEGDSSAVTIPSKHKEPETFGLVSYDYGEAMPLNASKESVSGSEQNRRDNTSDSDDSVDMGLDSTPSRSPSNLVSPRNTEVQSSDEVMSDTTPTTTPSGTFFLAKTNYSSWREEYPLNGSQVSSRVLETVEKFTKLRKTGGNINRDLRRQKKFKNPQYLEHLIQTNGLLETGSNFRKNKYNPNRWEEDPKNFFDALGQAQSDLMDKEKKEQEKEQSRKENDRKRPPQHRDDNRNNKRYK
jgi:hypothetical protein